MAELEAVGASTPAAAAEAEANRGAAENDTRDSESDVLELGASSRMGAFCVWLRTFRLLSSLLISAFVISLVIFSIGIYCHNDLNSTTIYTALNAVPWFGGLLTCLVLLIFLPIHLRPTSAESSSMETLWALLVGLCVIIDLLTMCFAAADGHDSKNRLSSKEKTLAIDLAALYGIVALELSISLFLYLGGASAIKERRKKRKEMARRPSEQPLDSGDRPDRREPRSMEPPATLDLETDDVHDHDFANAPPATGGSYGGAVSARARPSSQVFDTASPMSINAQM